MFPSSPAQTLTLTHWFVAVLVHTTGYSALVGLGVLLVGIPFQAWLFGQLIGTRQKQMKIVDLRVRLLQEILQGIRVIKLMAYEEYFEGKIKGYRKDEMKRLRWNCVMRGLLTLSCCVWFYADEIGPIFKRCYELCHGVHPSIRRCPLICKF